MITKSLLFRQHHFFELLNSFNPEKGPIDLFISLYFRHNPQLGSKDRLYVVERIYTYMRWKLLIETLLDRMGVLGDARKEALLSLLEKDLPSLSTDPSLEPHIQVSFPLPLYEALCRTFGEQTPSLCRACNESAPVTLRVNSLKTTRSALCQMLKNRGIEVEEDPSAPLSVRVLRRANFYSFPEFRMGYFEVQDAGSQLVADLVDAVPGQAVLDFCAGSGGKSLAFAPKLQNRGQIYLHDIREESLREAKKRLCRAGIQNAQLISATDAKRLKRLAASMDWVLVDAPCSGTGTLRRNPDMKWKFSEETVRRLCAEQRKIFSEALSYLKPGGSIVYATCSLLKEENEDQIEYFLKSFPLKLVGEPFRSDPANTSMDGFFAVSLGFCR